MSADDDAAARDLAREFAELGELVREFSTWMHTELDANWRKGPPRSWRRESVAWGLSEVRAHVEKLQRAVERGGPSDVREHAADVANCALMLADICGVFREQPPAPHREGDAAHYVGGSE